MRFDVTFNHGNLGNESVRELVVANDINEAMDKAYDIAHRRNYWRVEIWVSEHIEGECNYNCVIGCQYFLDGKKDDKKGEARVTIKATSYEDAKSKARDKYLGKYYYQGTGKLGSFRCLFYGDKWLEDNEELFNKPQEYGQSVKMVSITDCYQ